MRITPVDTTKFGGITIKYQDNKHVKFIANEVLDMVRKNGTPATFSTDYIELTGKITSNIRQNLNKLKIMFKEN